MSFFGIKTNRIELWFFLAIRKAVSMLSIRTARRLGRIGGLLSFYSFLRRRHYALRNLKWVYPEMSRPDRHRLARRIYRSMGASLLESTVWSTRSVTPESDRFEVVGGEHLERLLESGRGFILLGAHYGVWETGLMPYEDVLKPVTVIAKRTGNPLMQAEADAWRTRRGFVQILSEGATLKIFRALKRGKRVGVIADQRVQPEAGILVPFLGIPAWSSPMAAAMSLRTGAPVLPHFAEPKGADGYLIEYLEPIEPDTSLGKGEEAIRAMTERYNAVVEERIRRSPERWFWVHERWSRIKKYRWNSTKERWRKRSGLPDLAVGGQGDAALPSALRKMVKAYRRGGPLQRGDCLVVSGATAEERRAVVAAMGYAVINAGRSFGWAEECVSGKLLGESVNEMDQFDVVAICLSGSESGDAGLNAASGTIWNRERTEALLKHRFVQRRSVILLGEAASARALFEQAGTRDRPVKSVVL